jgi:CDP-glucose 4,6-dehydratase
MNITQEARKSSLNRPFWSGKRVLVTGHTGFKGSWISLWLSSLGAQVVGFALAPPTNPSLFKLARLSELMTHVEGDIRDLDQTIQTVSEHRPDIIIHMAAQPLVRLSYSQPVATYATNVMGTVHLLEAVRRVRTVRAVVSVTSDKCYENREWEWGYRETEPMGGHDPYSSSKGCAELVCASYRNSFFPPDQFDQHGVAIATVRAGNVIGGGDWSLDRLVPDIVRSISTGKRPLIRNPHAIRPWQHVLDPLSGYLRLAEKLWTDGAAYAQAWNFGPDDEDARSVDWITDRLCSLWGDGAGWDHDGRSHPHEAIWLKLDISKARQRLGWSPRWRLDDALTEVVAFNRAWLKGADMRAVALDHIAHYEAGKDGASELMRESR